MSEREGTALLKARFEAAGFAIQEGYPYEKSGVRFSMDGFDPKRGVGFEYVTTEAGDRAEITPAVIAHLESRMEKGEIAVLLLDEREAPSTDLLEFAAVRFLEHVAKVKDRRPATTGTTQAQVKKKAAKKKKAPAKKKNKRVVKKKAAKK